MKNKKCRCGFDGDPKDHPCHGQGHTCKKPGTFRLYNMSVGDWSLAGCQPKLLAHDTYACDECWGNYKQIVGI